MSALEAVAEKIKVLSEAEACDLLAWLDRRQRLRDQEDEQDILAARRALAEPGENIPWEKVKEEAGLK
ncbi:MAG: hypothetical protein HY674_04250 [Chloroflexi bacterium]|nr:hypothetical protein [Chloroflexota bacterium]